MCRIFRKRNKIYGFYSADMANRGCPTYVYSTPDGYRVDVTIISFRETSAGAEKWKDLQPMGELKEEIK